VNRLLWAVGDYFIWILKRGPWFRFFALWITYSLIVGVTFMLLPLAHWSWAWFLVWVLIGLVATLVAMAVDRRRRRSPAADSN
jgi:O-antigen/teichoic acid export membrane protein